MYTRLKCCNDRFAANPQYIFHALEWIEKNAVASSVHFDERQQFHWEIKVDQLVNHSNVRRMILMIKFSYLKSSEYFEQSTSKYFHNKLLDVLAKNRQFGVYTFSLTCSAAEFQWSEIIPIVARQYRKTITDDQVNAMDWSTKVNYVRRNSVTVVKQINYAFNKL